MRRPVTGLVVSAFAIPMLFLGSDEEGQRDGASTEPDVEAPPGPGDVASALQLPGPAFAKAEAAIVPTDLDFGNQTVALGPDGAQAAPGHASRTRADALALAMPEHSLGVEPVDLVSPPSSPPREKDLAQAPVTRPAGAAMTLEPDGTPSASQSEAVPADGSETETEGAMVQAFRPDRAIVWDEALHANLSAIPVHADFQIGVVGPAPEALAESPGLVTTQAPVIALAPNAPSSTNAKLDLDAGRAGPDSGQPRALQPALARTSEAPSRSHEIFTLAKFDRALPSTTPGNLSHSAGPPVLATTSVPMTAVEPVTAAVDRLPVPAFGLARTQLETQPSSAGTTGVSQPDRVQTLQDALRQSYSSNPRLLAERASLRSADYDYTAARSVYGPQLDAFATLAFTHDQSEAVPGTYLRNQAWTQTAGLILTQPLLTFGRGAAGQGQATATIEYRRASLRVTQDRIALDVISAYVGSLREAGAVTIARENVRLLQQELADARVRFDLEDMTATDLQQVQARLALGQSVLLEAKARLSKEQALFYSAVGVAPGELAQPERLELPFRSISEAYAAADAESPLIWAAKAREKVSRSQLAAADAERRPSVSFRGTADYGPLTDYSSELHAKRLRGQITLSIPLIDGGRRSAEIGKAQEANQADWRLIDASIRETRTEVGTTWNRLLAAQQSVQYYQTAVQSAKEAFEGAKVQERAGLRTTLEVLDLARDLLNVRNGYNQALTEEYLARASVLSAVGRLNPELLVPDMERYDPGVHFAKIKRNADIPLLTGLLSGLDDLAGKDLRSDRPSRDSASLIATGVFAPEP